MRIVAAFSLVSLTAIGCIDSGIGPSQMEGAGGDVSTGMGGPVEGPGFTNDFDEPVFVADTPPPPVSGGTLLATASNKIAVLSDPDHDQMLVVDLDKIALSATIALNAGDEPGRLVEDAAGRIHVALRGAGALATLDPLTGTLLSRRSVCQYPRGLAYDAKADAVHVACAGGELVTMPVLGTSPQRKLKLDSDLRDIVIDGDHLLVSRFRAAELLVVGADGQVSARLKPAGIDPQPSNGGPEFQGSFKPAVAWRTIGTPKGGALMVFQEEQTSEVQPQPGGYAGMGCGGIVRTAVSWLKVDAQYLLAPRQQMPLPIDIAASADGSEISIASAGTTVAVFENLKVASFGLAADPGSGVDVKSTGVSADPCVAGDLSATPMTKGSQPLGQVVAVARDSKGRILAQTREPYTLMVDDRAITLPGTSRRDTGHEIFHMGTSAGIACASCHPEGREDGHIWSFTGLGQRRTQSIGGGILGTEPFHWTGDMATFSTLAHEVFGSRMAGPSLKDGHVQALAGWIDKIPAWKPIEPEDLSAVERGRALFNDVRTACASCHSGQRMTNNKSVDVGTGREFQVPSLVGVVRRAPYLHEGCANTLLNRFGPCGGDKHGDVSALTDSQRLDLVSYLSSL